MSAVSYYSKELASQTTLDLLAAFYDLAIMGHSARPTLQLRFQTFKDSLAAVQSNTLNLAGFGSFKIRELPQDQMNSFYRAITFSFFERLISEGNDKRLQLIINNVQSRRVILSEGDDQSGFLREIYQKKFSTVLGNVLIEIKSGKSTASVIESFWRLLINQQYYFIILMRYIKGLLINMLSQVDPATLKIVLQSNDVSAASLIGHLKNVSEPSQDLIKFIAYAFDTEIFIYQKTGSQYTRKDFKASKTGGCVHLLRESKLCYRIIYPDSQYSKPNFRQLANQLQNLLGVLQESGLSSFQTVGSEQLLEEQILRRLRA